MPLLRISFSQFLSNSCAILIDRSWWFKTHRWDISNGCLKPWTTSSVNQENNILDGKDAPFSGHSLWKRSSVLQNRIAVRQKQKHNKWSTMIHEIWLFSESFLTYRDLKSIMIKSSFCVIQALSWSKMIVCLPLLTFFKNYLIFGYGFLLVDGSGVWEAVKYHIDSHQRIVDHVTRKNDIRQLVLRDEHGSVL